MPIDQKQFSGFMNTDDSEYVMNPIHHKEAFNGVFRGSGANTRFEGVKGNTLITNTLPAGTNVCINAMFDPVKQRIFYFNYNSNSNHGIYIYYTKTNTVTPLIISNTDTDGDVLLFTLSYILFNVNIIYGDDTQGDILYWLNSQKQPCKINIDRQLAGGYGTVQRSYLDVIKAPFSIPPQAAYEDDATVTVNRLRKTLFQFRVRAVYDDNDKSVWSAHSVLPLPLNAKDVSVDSDQTKNSRIKLIIPTGKPNVKKIEIAAAQNLGTAFSDFFSIAILDKGELSINDDDVTTYDFYNNQAYDFIDTKESAQLFDLVPIYANAQELLNGNTLDYAGITEGYDLLPSLGSTAVAEGVIDNYRTQPTEVLFAVQNGDTIGTAGSNIHIVVIGKINENTAFNVYTTGFTVNYTALSGDDSTDVINGLSADAVTHGFTVVSSDANNLVISKTAQQLLRFQLVPDTTVEVGDNDTTFAYDWASAGNLVLQYFDADGRTSGSQITDALSFQTGEYTEASGVTQIPKLDVSIYHQPPPEAYYFSIGRTKDLSKELKIQWITDRTFKDEVESADGYFYAYVSIESLNQYISDHSSSSFLAYSFVAGDRIRFIKLFPQGGTTTPVIETQKDFEIQGQLVNPIINGTQYQGQFLKIYLPTVDISFDFGIQTHSPVTDPIDYANYFIELYRPALSVSNDLNVNYEFGERYKIGNPTLATRFHQGMNQNQSTDYATPATFTLTQGQYYFRKRTINVAPELNFTLVEGDVSELDYIPMTLDNAFNTTGYSAQTVAAGAVTGTLSASDNWMINVTDGASYTYNIKGNVILKSVNSSANGFNLKLYFTKTGTTNTQTLTTAVAPIPTGQLYEYVIDTSFTVPATFDKVFMLFISADTALVVNVVSGTLKITDTARTYNQFCIDPNFSDSIQSKVNSDGRPFIFDKDMKQVYYSTLLRWGLSYQVDTNINQSNRFYATNFDEFDKSKGAVMRIKTKDRIQWIFQERACGQIGVYAKFLQDSGNTNILTTTDVIVTSNNVQYYQGAHGVGQHPESCIFSANACNFIDCVTGDDIRLSTDGFTLLGQTYKGQYTLRDILVQYNKDWTNATTGAVKVVGTYDFFENQYVRVLQSGVNGDDSIPAYTYAFSEMHKGYSAFFDYKPEFIICAEDVLYSWKNGGLYKHDNTTNYCNFYGVQYYPSITLVFNDKVALKKTFKAVAYQGNQYWISDTNGDIKTSLFNSQTGLQQISQLKAVDYEINEGMFYAGLLFDANSNALASTGLLEGDNLEGNWISIKFTYKGSSFSFLYLPYVNWQINQRNF